MNFVNHRENADTVRTLLRERDQWHVWLWTYGISHSVMQIAIHPNNYTKHYRVVCTLCERFEGKLQGGPYALELRDLDLDGAARLELCALDGTFRLVCHMIKFIGRHEELALKERIQI